MITQNEIQILSNKLNFYSKLTQAQKDMITQNAVLTHFSKGQSIYCGEYECIGVLIIKSGTVRTFITSDEGREVTLYRLESGDICILSASCILQNIDFDVSINAETECDIIQISFSVFSRLFKENINVELFSYKLTTKRFSDVMWAMQQILFISFDKRLARFLVDECNKTSHTDIHMTHEQIASYLGSAREVVSRMLKYFANEGLVKLSRGNISVIDLDKLNSLT